MRWSLLIGALAALALLLHGESAPSAEDPDILTTRAAGSFSLSNSLDGSAIFSADNIRPGDAVTGSVTITNTGTLRTVVRLAQDTVADAPGPGGGVLSSRLGLRVRDVTNVSAPVAVYAGELGAMPELAAGVLDPGESRNYEFSALLPHGTGDNAFEGSALSARYVWGAGEPPPPPVDPDPSSPGANEPPTEERDLRDRPPRLRLRVPHDQRVVKLRRFVAYARCNEACRMRASAAFGAKSGRPTPARRLRRGRVGANKWVRLAFRVPRARMLSMRRELRMYGPTTILLTVTARDDGGNATAKKRRVLLRTSGRPSPGIQAPHERHATEAERERACLLLLRLLGSALQLHQPTAAYSRGPRPSACDAALRPVRTAPTM